MSRTNGRAVFFEAASVKPGSVGPGTGRQAMFSAPPRRRGTVVMECSGCEARTSVPLLQLPSRLLFSVWMPCRAHSRYLMCPACHRLTWNRVHWTTLLDNVR